MDEHVAIATLMEVNESLRTELKQTQEKLHHCRLSLPVPPPDLAFQHLTACLTSEGRRRVAAFCLGDTMGLQPHTSEQQDGCRCTHTNFEQCLEQQANASADVKTRIQSLQASYALHEEAVSTANLPRAFRTSNVDREHRSPSSTRSGRWQARLEYDHRFSRPHLQATLSRSISELDSGSDRILERGEASEDGWSLAGLGMISTQSWSPAHQMPVVPDPSRSSQEMQRNYPSYVEHSRPSIPPTHTSSSSANKKLVGPLLTRPRRRSAPSTFRSSPGQCLDTKAAEVDRRLYEKSDQPRPLSPSDDDEWHIC